MKNFWEEALSSGLFPLKFPCVEISGNFMVKSSKDPILQNHPKFSLLISVLGRIHDLLIFTKCSKALPKNNFAPADLVERSFLSSPPDILQHNRKKFPPRKEKKQCTNMYFFKKI